MDVGSEIQRILHAKELYAVLDVPHNVEFPKLLEKFRLYAGLCHPGRCSHPDARRAFNAVAQAYAALSDDARRELYDRSGAKGLGRDVTDKEAEALFAAVDLGERGPRAPSTTLQARIGALLEKVFPYFLAILMVSLYYMWYRWDQNRPFSLRKRETSGFTIARRTEGHDIAYFVSAMSNKELTKNSAKLKEVERKVYREHLGELQNQCNKASMPNRFGQRGDTSSCDELRRLTTRFGL